MSVVPSMKNAERLLRMGKAENVAEQIAKHEAAAGVPVGSSREGMVARLNSGAYGAPTLARADMALKVASVLLRRGDFASASRKYQEALLVLRGVGGGRGWVPRVRKALIGLSTAATGIGDEDLAERAQQQVDWLEFAEPGAPMGEDGETTVGSVFDPAGAVRWTAEDFAEMLDALMTDPDGWAGMIGLSPFLLREYMVDLSILGRVVVPRYVALASSAVLARLSPYPAEKII